jgi:hypothetical protein
MGKWRAPYDLKLFYKPITGSSLTGRGLWMTPKMLTAQLEARDKAGRSTSIPTHACSGPTEPDQQ